MTQARDHGGGLDAAIARYGGVRADWVDLSTGINPVPYPVGDVDPQAWTALPDSGAMDRLLDAARTFWHVPDGAEIVAANGASAIIARLPVIFSGDTATIPAPTYNEHAAAFRAQDWTVQEYGAGQVTTVVHPNNPDGRLWSASDIAGPTVIDESFCDVVPERTLVGESARDGVIVIKSFGKFWGLAGLRLGFAIGQPDTLAPLRDLLGPWAVSGPALAIGARALADQAWADETRARLAVDADRLDGLMMARGAKVVGGTTLFRLYEVDDAARWQDQLAQHHIWSRVFPYSKTWLRLGLPHPDDWDRLRDALGSAGGAMAQPSGA